MCVVCVYLEDLKAVNVQDANVEVFMVLLHGFVDALSKTHVHSEVTGVQWAGLRQEAAVMLLQ